MRLNAFIFSLVLPFLLYSSHSYAQSAALDLDSLDLENIRANFLKQRKEAEILSRRFDSLFLKKEYNTIINECESKSSESHLDKILRYNLIAAHYFAGNKELSKSLIQKELTKHTTGVSASTLLSENYTGYLYFLSIDENWEYIEKRVNKIAAQADISEKEKRAELFDFFIADQKIRLFYDYKANDVDRLFKFENYITKQEFEEKGKRISNAIFEFYRKNGKLFSKEEVGDLHYIQLVFLLHESDLKRREYYLEILSNAVNAGVFPIEKKLDFLIANELIKVNWENMTDVIAEQEIKMRTAYGLPKYKFSLVM